jgi:hypothetical protein
MSSTPKYNLNHCKEWAFTKNGKCLSEKYTGSKKLEWECEFGHKWMARFHHVRKGTWCSICHKAKLKSGINSIRLTKQEVERRLNKLGFEFLSAEYTNSLQKYTLKCSKGHIFDDKRLSHIISGVVGCSFCNNYFNAERKFRNKLEKIFKVPFPKARPKWLINPATGYRLELDCYNEEFKLAFEYDGQFHFEVRKGINNDLETTKKLDALKEKLCLEHGIVLIRVPYFLKDKELYDKIIQGLKVVHKKDYWRVIKNMEQLNSCTSL